MKFKINKISINIEQNLKIKIIKNKVEILTIKIF